MVVPSTTAGVARRRASAAASSRSKSQCAADGDVAQKAANGFSTISRARDASAGSRSFGRARSAGRAPRAPQPLRQLGERIGAARKQDRLAFQLIGQHVEQRLRGAAAGGRPPDPARPQSRLGRLPHGEHLVRARDAQRPAWSRHRTSRARRPRDAEDGEVRARRDDPARRLRATGRCGSRARPSRSEPDRRRRRGPRRERTTRTRGMVIPSGRDQGGGAAQEQVLRRAPGRPPRPPGPSPERSPRSVRRPSSENTAPASETMPPFTRARPATGARQPASSVSRKARSARIARCDGA